MFCFDLISERKITRIVQTATEYLSPRFSGCSHFTTFDSLFPLSICVCVYSIFFFPHPLQNVKLCHFTSKYLSVVFFLKPRKLKLLWHYLIYIQISPFVLKMSFKSEENPRWICVFNCSASLSSFSLAQSVFLCREWHWHFWQVQATGVVDCFCLNFCDNSSWKRFRLCHVARTPQKWWWVLIRQDHHRSDSEFLSALQKTYDTDFSQHEWYYL